MEQKAKKYRELVELKGLLRERKKDYQTISSLMGISQSAFSNKINGKTVFSLLEALKLIKLLEINPEEAYRYFF